MPRKFINPRHHRRGILLADLIDKPGQEKQTVALFCKAGWYSRARKVLITSK